VLRRHRRPPSVLAPVPGGNALVRPTVGPWRRRTWTSSSAGCVSSTRDVEAGAGARARPSGGGTTGSGTRCSCSSASATSRLPERPSARTAGTCCGRTAPSRRRAWAAARPRGRGRRDPGHDRAAGHHTCGTGVARGPL